MRKKALVIGEYYPIDSIYSKKTNDIAIMLREKKIEPYLLSASWCKVNEESFCKAENIFQINSPFHEKFFVDPLQLRMHKLDIILGLYSLSIKIIKKNEIDVVIFADSLMFYPIVSLIKHKYPSIPICGILDYDRIGGIFDDYIFDEVINSFHDLDYIIANNEIQIFLEKNFGVDSKKYISYEMITL